MDALNDILYHLSCPSCGADWWDKDAFPSYCPYCNANRDWANVDIYPMMPRKYTAAQRATLRKYEKELMAGRKVVID